MVATVWYVVLQRPSISWYHALLQYWGETDRDRALLGFIFMILAAHMELL
jgi:hypothetical protein